MGDGRYDATLSEDLRQAAVSAGRSRALVLL